jgi:asparagine synthase (glutamine-hydrolysing)
MFQRNFFNRYLTFLGDELKLINQNKSIPLKNIMGFFESEKRVLLNDKYKLNSYQYLDYLTENVKDANISNEFLQKMRIIEYKLRLPELLLMRVDKFTMMYSIEARVPFMDYNLVEYGMKINPKLHHKGGETKYLFKKLLKEKLPKEIIYRRKVGFNVPLSKREFLNPLVEIAKKELLNNDMSKFFDLNYVNKIIKLYENRKQGYDFRMWVLLNFALWHKLWIKNEKIEKLL